MFSGSDIDRMNMVEGTVARVHGELGLFMAMSCRLAEMAACEGSLGLAMFSRVLVQWHFWSDSAITIPSRYV